MKLMLCAFVVVLLAVPGWAVPGITDSVPAVREAAQFAEALDYELVQNQWDARLLRRTIPYLEGLFAVHGAFLKEALVENVGFTEADLGFAVRIALGIKLLGTEDYDQPIAVLESLAAEGDARASHALAAKLSQEYDLYEVWKHLAMRVAPKGNELLTQAYQDAFALLAL